MAYELLKPYRLLAKDIPATILNSTHRLIITTFLQYHSEAKGVFKSFPTLASELALGKRALLQNLHYLGDGLLWKDGKRVPCANPKCKNHLAIILGTHYARAGKGQVYRINFESYRALASRVRSTSPTNALSVRSEVKEGAPKSESECATPHPYIPDIPYIRKKKSYDNVNYERWHVISQVLPPLLVSQWIHTKESEKCLDLILQGTTLNAFVASLRRHDFAQGYDQTGLYMSHIRKRAGVSKPMKALSSDKQLEADLQKLSEFDLEAELKKLDSSIDFSKTFKLPD